MFWRERDKDKNKIGQQLPPSGQVRVLVVGDAGVGKSSLVHLIINGTSISNIQPTVGCTVSVKHMLYGSHSSSSSSNSNSESDRDYFIELWDVCGHDRYKDCRSLFYSQINGIIFVHDLSQRKSKSNLQKWASEISATGSFSAPLGSSSPVPVPFLIIGNKADIAAKDGVKGSAGNLVDVALHWVERQGLLSPSEELPLTETFPGSGGLITQAAKGGRFDKEAISRFFVTLIKRRYFSEDQSTQHLWTSPTPTLKAFHSRLGSPDDEIIKSYSSVNGENYRYNSLPPLPAQRTLTPPPTSYPQQPISSDYYTTTKYNSSSNSEAANVKSKRADITV